MRIFFCRKNKYLKIKLPQVCQMNKNSLSLSFIIISEMLFAQIAQPPPFKNRRAPIGLQKNFAVSTLLSMEQTANMVAYPLAFLASGEASFATGFRTVNQPVPQTEITNGIIKARIYLPNRDDGYYRGSRFDWSGVIAELEYKGHSYFGQWFEKYNPTNHDAIMGPVEDFYPVGYDEAKAGGNFLKIGIGMLSKPEELKYFFGNPYAIINPGSWKIKTKPRLVTFNHTLKDIDYSYQYQKTVELIKGKPEMVLSHSLKNTGKLPIETEVYDHNFFVIDDQPSGKDIVIAFPFNLKGDARRNSNFARLDINKIIFQKELINNEQHQYLSLVGFSNNKQDYAIKIENHKTGAAVQITSDQPLSKLAFWSAPKTVCPEPYIHISVKPGETFKWKIFYQFYICDTIN